MALIQCDFFSETLGFGTSMNIILPQAKGKGLIGMQEAPGNGLPPVLYLLHGLSDDHTTWIRRTSIERYVASLGLAVVMPAVQRGYYTDMAEGSAYWTFVSEELPKIVQAFFRVSARREDTYVAGLSMGGYGAFKLALRQPERFAAAASLSGALNVVNSRAWDDEARSAEMRRTFGDRGRFSGSENDLYPWLEGVARGAGPKPRLYQCCGTEDYLYGHNIHFRDRARALDYPGFTYEEGKGAHKWEYWDTMIRRALDWFAIVPVPALSQP